MKKISSLLIILGLIIAFGTAGAGDVGSISLLRMFVQSIASIFLITVGYLGKTLLTKHKKDASIQKACPNIKAA